MQRLLTARVTVRAAPAGRHVSLIGGHGTELPFETVDLPRPVERFELYGTAESITDER